MRFSHGKLNQIVVFEKVDFFVTIFIFISYFLFMIGQLGGSVTMLHCFLKFLHSWSRPQLCSAAPLTLVSQISTEDSLQRWSLVQAENTIMMNGEENRFHSLDLRHLCTFSVWIQLLLFVSSHFFSLLAKEICSWKPYVAVVGLTLTRLFSLMNQFLSFLQNCWDDV